MKLLSHLIKTDLRRFRLILAAFVVVVIGATALEMVRPILAANPRVRVSLGIAATLIWILETLSSAVIVALVVQAHRLVGSDAFWMTRPISRNALLASKLVLLAAVSIVVPVICDVVLMTAYRVPPGRMAGVVAQAVLLRMICVILLMSAAALTRSLTGFGMLCAAGVVVFAVFVTITAMLSVASLEEDGTAFVAIGVSPLAAVPDSTADLVFAVLLMGAGILLLMTQYRTRMRTRSVLVGAAGVALAVGVSSVWPWSMLRAQVRVPEWAKSEASLNLSVDPLTISFAPESVFEAGGRQRTWRFGRAGMTATNVPQGWEAMVRLARAQLALTDGTRIESRGMMFTEPVSIHRENDDPKREVMRDVLDVKILAGLQELPLRGAVLFRMREADFQAHQGKSGAYSGSFIVDLSHTEIATALPLRPGSSYQEGADRFVIDEVSFAEMLSVRVRRSGASTIFDREAPRSFSYYFRNRKSGEAVAAWQTALLDQATGFGSFGGSHVTMYGVIGFDAGADLVSPQRAESDDRISIDEDWVATAELVIVRTTQGGAVMRDLHVSALEIRSPPVKPSAAF